jgi:hypothetical protein
VIAILVDDEGAVQVLPLDRRGAERTDAVLLQQGERYLEVPYSTWREFLGKTARLRRCRREPRPTGHCRILKHLLVPDGVRAVTWSSSGWWSPFVLRRP